MGIAGVYGCIRTEHGRLLGVQAAPAVVEHAVVAVRRLTVDSPDGGQRVVAVPQGTRSHGALSVVMREQVGWRNGLVVRYLSREGWRGTQR